MGEKAQWNFDLLDEELADLDINMKDFGFDIDIQENFDEENLDDEREKEKINVSIVFDKYEDLEKVKTELEEIANKANGNMSIKMI